MTEPAESTDPAERAMILSQDGWGRIIALIAAADGDISGAEDALSTALERAVTAWRDQGPPANPEGWLYRVALNARRDVWKSAAARTSTALDEETIDRLGAGASDLGTDPGDPDALPDRRLELLAACAHPDIDPPARPLLMLSAVMGMTAKQVAAAMALPAATVSARLTRAKKRVAGLGVAFGSPDRLDLESRLPDVHETIYGAFAIEWAHAAAQPRDGMIGEALYLSRLVAQLCPGDGESHGLAALIHLSAARFPARRSVDGRFVPLTEQNPDLWDRTLTEAGERHLVEVHRCGHVGRFGLEAAIQLLHMAGIRTGSTDWPMLLRLHDDLEAIAPSLGGSVSRAAVLAEVDGPEAGLSALDALDADSKRLSAFQPAWVLRAHLLTRLGRTEEAAAARRRALDLTTDPAERAYLSVGLT
ncbi:MAG TPA: RNA polymerase [Brevibacterium epidermidis]|uniref:RNA polymerase n=1 Tax=Brevibacterium epidermidis TaxID=1698 RepID=A0A9D2UK33_BREEP|nr:RNA polymerase [Brevibacterium epidermidis]